MHDQARDSGTAARRVWDLPTRVFHALMIACFAGAWLTGDSERWRLAHLTFGLTMAGLVVFRLVWGVVGSEHARFADFVRGPRAVLAYLRSLVGAHPQQHVGHNPAGGWAVLGLLGLTALATATGWAAHEAWFGAGDALGELHEGLTQALLLLVGVHVAGVVVSSWLHHENLARAMVTGRKRLPAGARDVRAWGAVAAVLLAAVLGFWALQWQSAPVGGALTAAAPDGGRRGHDDD